MIKWKIYKPYGLMNCLATWIGFTMNWLRRELSLTVTLWCASHWLNKRDVEGAVPYRKSPRLPQTRELASLAMTEGVTPIQSVGDTSIAPRQSPARRANIKCDLSHTRGPGGSAPWSRDQTAWISLGILLLLCKHKEVVEDVPRLVRGEKDFDLVKT